MGDCKCANRFVGHALFFFLLFSLHPVPAALSANTFTNAVGGRLTRECLPMISWICQTSIACEQSRTSYSFSGKHASNGQFHEYMWSLAGLRGGTDTIDENKDEGSEEPGYMEFSDSTFDSDHMVRPRAHIWLKSAL